jgi:glycosyltransferase involved in cell wall biosynthesis
MPAKLVTAVQEAIASAELHYSVRAIAHEAKQAVGGSEHEASLTALFIAALDGAKRLDFLFDATARVYEAGLRFCSSIVGDGPLRDWLVPHVADAPWARVLGALRGDDRATPLVVARAVVIPGRVGLAALNAFAVGLPVVVTEWPYTCARVRVHATG